MELFFQFLLFFAETATIVAAILVVFIFIIGQRKKSSATAGSLEIKDISQEYTDIKDTMLLCSMDEAEAKEYQKELKKQKKQEKKQAKSAKKQKKVKVVETQSSNKVSPQASTDSSALHLDVNAEAESKLQSCLGIQPADKNEGQNNSYDNQQNNTPSDNKNASLDLHKSKAKLFVLSFNGSMDAREVEDLRQEVTAVLAVFKSEDKIVVKLESPGGVVHGYGLAASQLMRFRNRNIAFTAVVDKVAASGGYMMACTANKIIAAPFAIVGSIGVVAQIPNFNRLLKKNDIDVELQTAGEYKRTLTMLGENTPEGRKKFQEELEETHLLFKDFVKENRPSVDIESVATGEHWFATQAKDKGLVDEIGTSDDFILSHIESHKIMAIKYQRRRKFSERVAKNTVKGIERLFFKHSKSMY